MSKPRILFMGTSAFAVPALEALAKCDVVIPAVYTQPPRPAGRGHKLKRTDVHEVADAFGLDVRTPLTLRGEEAKAEMAALTLDLALVASYGLLLPQSILDIPRLGCVNIHASKLPRWRGASPIQQAILAGDRQTAVDFFQMEAGLDTGPVLLERLVEIMDDDTSSTLHDRLAQTGAYMIREFIDGMFAGQLQAKPQEQAGFVYAPKITKTDSIIDWNQSAQSIERRLRAFHPWPGISTSYQNQKLRVLAAKIVAGTGDAGTIIGMPLTVACGSDALEISQVQRQGRKPMSAADLQRGFAIPLGSRLGE